MTRQRALMPQVPGQGSMHFWLLQASFNEHSGLIVHSGRHVGGEPKNPGIHEQTGCSFMTLH